MSFLTVFKGELVTDPGWGILYVIMGSGQGTLVSEPYCLLLLFEAWEGDEKKRVPKCSPWGRHRHTEPKTCEPLGPSLPTCHNPVLKHFLYSCPSLVSSHATPIAMPADRVIIPSLLALLGAT